ncbi:MAG: ECF-type sigma factor [Planctomycetota bacterium]
MTSSGERKPKDDVDLIEEDITELLGGIRLGEADAMERLMAAVYVRLREIAKQIGRMRGIPGTLTATAVVNESFARLKHADGFRTLQNRAHLYATFSKTIVNVLVDYARRKQAQKRGGHLSRVELDHILVYFHDDQEVDLLELKAALDQLSLEDPRAAEVVVMRFFGGFTVDQTAESLEVSPTTVYHDWRYARSRLAQILRAQ